MSRARRLKSVVPAGRWLLAAGIITLVAFFLKQSARQRPDWALRDDVADVPPLSAAHASLGGGGTSSCRLCHVGSLVSPSDSAVCLSCHDGALASGGLVHGGSHPIGMQYEVVRLREPDRFNELTAISGVRLDAGRVGCVSCHRIHMKADERSRQGIVESSCETCHRL